MKLHRTLLSILAAAVILLGLIGPAQAAVPLPLPGDEHWQAGFTLPGLNDSVNALARFDSTHIYAGGSFETAGGTFAKNIARWDGARWRPLGEGLNGNVQDLVVDSSGGLYACGHFTASGSTPMEDCAYWNGSAWSQLFSTDVDGSVYAIVLDEANNMLYVGGNFSSPYNHIAGYDLKTRAWKPLGTAANNGTNDTVSSMALGPGGNVFASGPFTSAGSVNVNQIAVYDPATLTWSPLGEGLDLYAHTMLYDAAHDILYVGGSFKNAGDALASYIASWSAGSWHSVGNLPLNDTVAALALQNNILYVGGIFKTVGEMSAPGLARYNASTGAWSAFGTGVNGGVYALLAYSDGSLGIKNLLIGGGFTAVNDVPAANIIRVVAETNWAPLKDGDGPGKDPRGALVITYGSLNALARDNQGSLYAGGDFKLIGSTTTSGAARWDGSSWHAMDSGLSGNMVNRLVVGPQDQLYASTEVKQMVTWNGAAWVPMGSVLPAYVDEIAACPDGNIYVGLYQAPYMVRWNGTDWESLGDGFNGAVYALECAPGGGLYAGGEFTTAGMKNGVPTGANYAAYWDGSAWSPLSSGLNGLVEDLLLDGQGRLYVAGLFGVAGTVTANNIAVWNTATAKWSTLGSGADNLVGSLAMDSGTGRLYAAGAFNTIGGQAARHIAVWDGGWHALGSGIPSIYGEDFNPVVDLLPVGRGLYVAGTFIQAGLKVSNNLAYWDDTHRVFMPGVRR